MNKSISSRLQKIQHLFDKKQGKVVNEKSLKINVDDIIYRVFVKKDIVFTMFDVIAYIDKQYKVKMTTDQIWKYIFESYRRDGYHSQNFCFHKKDRYIWYNCEIQNIILDDQKIETRIFYPGHKKPEYHPLAVNHIVNEFDKDSIYEWFLKEEIKSSGINE